MENIAHWATLVSALIAIGTFGFGIRTFKRQMNAQAYLEYTKRYDQIMEALGPDCRFDLNSVKVDKDTKLAVLRYLNLCSEEYYLYSQKYLANDLWQYWGNELERTLCTPLFREAWKSLKSEFDSFVDFQKYVENAQRESNVEGAWLLD